MQMKVMLTMRPMLILHKQTKAGCAGSSSNVAADDEEHLTLMGGMVGIEIMGNDEIDGWWEHMLLQ